MARRSIFGAMALASLCALDAWARAEPVPAINVSVPCTGAGGGTPGLIAAIQDANNQGGGRRGAC
jgi:hypothetical protein